MKYINKFNESRISTLNDLSDDELKEKLKWLRIEMKEIQEDITSVNKILTKRKEQKESDYYKSLPKSVFDLDEDEFEWVFKHGHGETPKHYDIAHKYISQLKGLHQTGFNPQTNQFYFTVSLYHFFDELEENYVENKEAIKSIKFLAENLKKVDEYVKFDITYAFDTHRYNDKLIINERKVIIEKNHGAIGRKEYNSIEEAIKKLVELDLESKDDIF